MRALLQQGKWDEGQELLALMLTSSAFPKPESETYNAVLLAQARVKCMFNPSHCRSNSAFSYFV
jgi:hypothetical protein